MVKSFIRGLGTLSLLALMAGSAFAQQTVLDVTAWKGNDTEPAGMPELLAKFQKENPDIKINFSYISRSDTNVVVPPRLQGDNPPDVLMVDMPLVKVWGDAGLLKDLGTGSDWYKNVPDNAKSGITIDGHAYFMPLESSPMGIFSNMGLLKKVGITKPPLTIDELKAACTALDHAGIHPLLLPGQFPNILEVTALGLEATKNKVKDLGDGKAKFADDPAFSKALDTVRELAAAKCFDPKEMAALDPFSTALSEFKAGNYAMFVQGGWNIADFKTAKGLDFVLGPIPSYSGIGVAEDLYGIGWAISAKAAHPKAAEKFLAFFRKPENLKVMIDAESGFSPYKDAIVTKPDPITAPYNEARMKGGIHIYPWSLLQWPKALETEMGESMVGFMLDMKQPNSKTLDRWDEAVEDSLD